MGTWEVTDKYDALLWWNPSLGIYGFSPPAMLSLSICRHGEKFSLYIRQLTQWSEFGRRSKQARPNSMKTNV